MIIAENLFCIMRKMKTRKQKIVKINENSNEKTDRHI